jgi:hypothetical protein
LAVAAVLFMSLLAARGTREPDPAPGWCRRATTYRLDMVGCGSIVAETKAVEKPR